MGDKGIVIGLVIFLVVFLLVCGIGGYYYYKKSGQSKSKRKSSRSSSKRKGKSKSRSRSRSKSSSRRSRSSKSRSKSSSSDSDKSKKSPRRRTSRSSSRSSSRSPSSSDKGRKKSRSKGKREAKKANLQESVGLPGGIKVDVGTKIGSGAPITGNNLTIISPPPVIDQGPKKDIPGNPFNAPIDQPIHQKVIAEKPEAPKDIPPSTITLPAPAEIHEQKVDPKVAYEGNPLSPEVANDLLKAKTNTHYIPPTTIPPEITVAPQTNTLEIKNTCDTSGNPKIEEKLERHNNYSGSLLTSNNLTYNTVNIMVNNNANEDINEVIEKAVNAIPDPNLKLSDVPGLPPSTKKNNNHDLESN
uniref:Uncharacterized protein n=1 Tax=Strongyloides papillosus TaxID=174720 RepID=A0A0N5BSZ8_STREA